MKYSLLFRISPKLIAFSLLIALVSPIKTVFAIQASPFSYTESQPDGSQITLYERGDEHFNWMEDAAGYTVVKNNNRFEYAVRGPSGRLKPNGLVVGRDNPKAAGLQKRVLPSAAVRALSAKKIYQVVSTNFGNTASTEAANAPDGVAPLGAIKNLVVMVRFSDHVSRTLPSAADIGVLFNAVGGDPSLAPTGSVKDVYFENSYGQMTLNSDINPGINDWITVSNTEAYYANGNSGDSTLWQALKEALDILDASIDFNDYDSDNDGRIDSIAFIHSGYGAEWGGTDAFGASSANRIWSHRWAIQPQWNSNDGINVFDYHISPGVWGTSGNAIGRIGVIAHETGHFFGLPDLYDTDSGGAGIGSWGMMANSWGFDGSQLHPPHFSPWSKVSLGWYSPTVISNPGEYTVNQAETNAEAYRIDAGFPSGEYLLIENRQSAGIETEIPQGGLAIWHIDENTGFNTEGYPGQSGWPGNGSHYQVALLQADGNYNLEKGNNRGDAGDVYHGNGVSSIGEGPVVHPNTDTYSNGAINQTGNVISDVSASAATMTFCLNGCGAQTEPLAPTGLTANATSSSSIALSWTDNSDNETTFRIERSLNGSTGWSTVASVGSNATSYGNSGLAASTEYFFRVAANNSIGDSPFSNTSSATTDSPPAFVDYVAASQNASEGTVGGGFSNTHSDNGSVQTITETTSGGNPRKRRSSLAHTWVFSVASGNSMTLTTNAWSSGSSDNDNFQFQWSVDNANYNNAFVVSSTSSGNFQSAALPSNLSGSVFVRVIDTDNSQGNSALDTVSVDYLVIRADNTPVTPPAGPTGLSANAVAHNQVDLSWNDIANDETGYELQRANGGSFATIATLGANATSYSDTGVSALQTYDYRVRAVKGATTSAFSNTGSAMTPDQPVGVINLTASGFKVKGKQQVDLNWSGSSATNVEVRRTGSSTITVTTANDGFYNDNIGTKGGATYQYEICDAGTSNCSNTVTVVF